MEEHQNTLLQASTPFLLSIIMPQELKHHTTYRNKAVRRTFFYSTIKDLNAFNLMKTTLINSTAAIRRKEKDGNARGTMSKSTNRCKQCSYRVTKCKLIFARKQCPLTASWGAVDINNGCTRLSNSIASQGMIKSNENGFLRSV